MKLYVWRVNDWNDGRNDCNLYVYCDTDDWYCCCDIVAQCDIDAQCDIVAKCDIDAQCDIVAKCDIVSHVALMIIVTAMMVTMCLSCKIKSVMQW